jgi:hypothetical protein
MSFGSGISQAAVTFTSRELFRIPFGKSQETLGTRIEGGRFLFPHTFAMDGEGHFYIYDSIHHRIARFSSEGRYEMEFRYPVTARQIFAHPDSRENLWLLISDPTQGTFYGVYDPHGKRLNAGIFGRYKDFRLHIDDDSTLHVILSSNQEGAAAKTYILDAERLLMRRENIAPPPEDHHQVRKRAHLYFIDAVPGAKEEAQLAARITDEKHRTVAQIKGTVIYITEQGDVYTRVGAREIDAYEVDGSRIGRVRLQGLRSACAAVRFDPQGNIYELDGIPDQTDEQVRRQNPAADSSLDFEDRHYTAAMPGLRMILWQRQ